ncbi:MAG: Dam family site-specific DNA-(adenine-N6)-methyltransferase [Rhodospirillales bacterium]|nr:Dam family site-specific DNA-(adenine-N6)-methyltransferase [Rhodospirillales bacterium]
MAAVPPPSGVVGVPPLKCQGIKTRLLPLIRDAVAWTGQGRWIEPFLGSGVVAFNLAPERALLADTNRHVIGFYRAIQAGRIGAEAVTAHLRREGERLRQSEGAHYYEVRARFNATADPLDFLFLNRAGFNGLMRFNRAGAFNVPFCRKPDRFRPALVTRIANQVAWVAGLLAGRDWRFEVADWAVTLAAAGAEDFVYADPPYLGRHADYHDHWTEADADRLAACLRGLPCGFAMSTWMGNRFRRNPHVARWFPGHAVRTQGHFYHLGAAETLRHPIEEGLVLGGPAAQNRAIR